MTPLSFVMTLVAALCAPIRWLRGGMPQAAHQWREQLAGASGAWRQWWLILTGPVRRDDVRSFDMARHVPRVNAGPMVYFLRRRPTAAAEWARAVQRTKSGAEALGLWAAGTLERGDPDHAASASDALLALALDPRGLDASVRSVLFRAYSRRSPGSVGRRKLILDVLMSDVGVDATDILALADEAISDEHLGRLFYHPNATVETALAILDMRPTSHMARRVIALPHLAGDRRVREFIRAGAGDCQATRIACCQAAAPEDFRALWCELLAEREEVAGAVLAGASPEQRGSLQAADLVPLYASSQASLRSLAIVALSETAQAA